MPHAVTAEVVEIDDKRVHVRVYTETESQKQILIGKGGTMVREIGRAGAARASSSCSASRSTSSCR